MRKGASKGLKASFWPLPALVVVLCLGVPVAVAAADPPHWLGAVETTDCSSNCHTLHQAQGGQLTAAATNIALCQSCHSSGLFPIGESDKAVPGAGGTSHAFEVPADNAARGAVAPDPGSADPEESEMGKRVPDGNIICSTCHDQHAAEAAMGGTTRIGPADKVATTDQGGTGSVTTSGTYTGPEGVWYLIEITADDSTFHFSKDNGISWSTPEQSIGPSVDLNDGFGVTVSFGGGSFVATERFEFFATYPFLRVPLGAVGSNLCVKCHDTWVMDKTTVNTYDGTYKSHPVNVTLPGTSDYHNPPLDGNGAEQESGGADSNDTNDLMVTGNIVHCLSCHGVHHADSNTLSVDGPSMP
jgi:predicted CXXCH cytochrome family protein